MLNLCIMIIAWFIFSILAVMHAWTFLSICLVGDAGLGVMLVAPLMVPLDIIIVTLLWNDMDRVRPSWNPRQALCYMPMVLNLIAAVFAVPYLAFMGFWPSDMRACSTRTAAVAPPLPAHARIVVHAMVWVALTTLVTYVIGWKKKRHRNEQGQPLLVADRNARLV